MGTAWTASSTPVVDDLVDDPLNRSEVLLWWPGFSFPFGEGPNANWNALNCIMAAECLRKACGRPSGAIARTLFLCASECSNLFWGEKNSRLCSTGTSRGRTRARSLPSSLRLRAACSSQRPSLQISFFYFVFLFSLRCRFHLAKSGKFSDILQTNANTRKFPNIPLDDLVDLDVANKSRTWNEHFNCSVSTDRYISSSWEFSSFMWNVNDFQILFELHLRVFPCLCACVSVCFSSFFIFIFFRLLRKWLSLVRWRGG